MSATTNRRRSGSPHPRPRGPHLACLLALQFLVRFAHAAPATTNAAWPVHELQPDAVWQLNLPDREPFEASGLALRADGALLSVNNRGSEVFRVAFLPLTNAANLVQLRDVFTESQLRHLPPRGARQLDVEGIALDESHRVYLCVEPERWILRCSPGAKRAQRLEIDWSPVRRFFSTSEPNASFEGVAVGGGRLYVANERQQGRIIEVDLRTLRVTADFEVRTHRGGGWDNHYSDLSWFGGRLYVLCRESRAVLEVDPATRAVVAEYGFLALEQHPEWRYRTRVPFVGIMEGLAVDARHFWLVTDNNDLPRERYPDDRRPSLFRCPRPGTPPPAP